MIAVAVEMVAARAIGMEYAPAAVHITRNTLRRHATGERGEALRADARYIPLSDDTPDLVTMVDVVEHLSPDELDRTLQEVRRICTEFVPDERARSPYHRLAAFPPTRLVGVCNVFAEGTNAPTDRAPRSAVGS